MEVVAKVASDPVDADSNLILYKLFSLSVATELVVGLVMRIETLM